MLSWQKKSREIKLPKAVAFTFLDVPMIKNFILALTLCSFLSAHSLVAEEETFYTDEDPELFNHGKFVGGENKDYLRAQTLEKKKTWAVAIGTSIIGIATVILVGKNHKK